jgi:hypothetical protein
MEGVERSYMKETRKLQTYFSSSSSIGTTTLSWVSACSTIVEHSQQEGFTECRCQQYVKTPNLLLINNFFFDLKTFWGPWVLLHIARKLNKLALVSTV